MKPFYGALFYFLLLGCQQPTPLKKKKFYDRNPLMFMPSKPLKKRVDPEKPAFFSKKISLNLSGTVPVEEALFELARSFHINIILDGSFKKKVALHYAGKDQTFEDILETLCSCADLQYRFEHGVLHIKQDTPYFKNHAMQFLLGSRSTKTQTSIHTDLLTKGLQAESHENGSSVALASEHTVDFWGELEKNIQLLLQDEEKKTHYNLNRYAGILSVVATQKQHRRIASYLKKLQKFVTAQILIEAKIIEVDLRDEYKAGVNWNVFLSNRNLNPLEKIGKISFDKDQFYFQVASNHLQGLVQFMEQFGSVRTLANPRQTVLNNQSAVLKVAHNEVFFEVQVHDDGHIKNNGHLSFIHQRAQSRVQTVPIGLILYVHPSYNSETGDITVSLHPTISRVVGMKKDPVVALYGRGVESQVPIVQVREMDSIIVAKEGQVIVTGGIMEERCEKNTIGVPGLSQVPFLGDLFKNTEEKKQITELVILLKLSIIE